MKPEAPKMPAAKASPTKNPADVLACPACRKEPALCLCSVVRKIPTRLHVLILQHPQEPDKSLGTARLAQTALENSTLRVGLSWPNLGKALGHQAQNSKWGVLYLGSRPEKKGSPGERPPRLQIQAKGSKELVPLEPWQTKDLEGVVVLDGTWSQAKALWWRNAWLLKLNRLVLNPARRSMYGNLRKEPRREALSTIEAVAEALEALGEKPEVSTELRSLFSQLLDRYRAAEPTRQSSSRLK